MQAAHGGMRVPGALHAIFVEHAGQPLGVVGQVGQSDGAILDEGDRFGVALHAHHDVQAGLAHLGDAGLEARVGGMDHGAGQAQIGHHLVQAPQAFEQRRVLMAMELHDQQRVGFTQDHLIDRGPVDGDAAAQIDHRPVDQLHRLGVERDEVLRRLHCPAEGGELANAHHLARLDRP